MHSLVHVFAMILHHVPMRRKRGADKRAPPHEEGAGGVCTHA